MKHFKLPAIVTAIVLPLALVVGLIAVTVIYQTETSRSRLMKRSEQLGSGIAVAACVLIAPFWLFAAAKVGKERREAARKKQ